MPDYLTMMLKTCRMRMIDKIIDQKNRQIQLNKRIKSHIVPKIEMNREGTRREEKKKKIYQCFNHI